MDKSHLILIPGLMCDEAVWEHQALGLRDIADITIADHGSSDSLTAMADAILQRAPERFALAGHSMGGRVAFQVFRHAPERVTAIALMDTACTPRAAGAAGAEEAEQRYRLLKKARQDGMHAMGAEWVQRMVHPERLFDRTLINAILEMIARKTPDIFEAQITALLNRPDARDVLPKIHCSALVLCGREDAWSALSHHEEMAAMIPNGRLVVVENCGHMSTMERPAEVTAAMRGWLTVGAVREAPAR
jgi:pimeloyl-ACP methyl ester carboxylesterase